MSSEMSCELPHREANPAASADAGHSYGFPAMSIDDVTLPASASPHPPAELALPAHAGGIPDAVLGAAILLLFGVILAFDIVTPADHVSVCFLYVIPLFLALAGRSLPVYGLAALATLLSGVGSFIQPPDGPLTATFYANRGIAVAVLWMAAALVAAHKKAERLVRANFEKEKLKSEHRRRFIDVLSHEIGTSLTTIDGQAFRLRKLSAPAGPPPADIAVRTEKIRRAVNHIKTVVQRVQLASEAGERTLHVRQDVVDLRALVTEAVHQAGEGRDAPPIETDLDRLPRFVCGDSDLLKQVMDNLLSNAIKYSSPGAPIGVEGFADGAQAVIAVADRGRGIPDDEQEMLFAPYYRARNSRGVPGAGIGLYVSERFVAGHGGAIDLRSRLGHGTTVTVRLPIGDRTTDSSDGRAADPVH